MRQKHSHIYKILDVYGLRTPLLSLNFGNVFFHKESITDTDFKRLIEHPILREGIYLASPELYKQLLKWEKGLLKDPKKIERLQFSILKYATRITSRCTPFGLFASCSSGSFGENTRVSLEDQSNYKRCTRLDTTFLAQLYQVLLEEPLIKSELLFYPNSSLYKINDHYRYVEYRIENKRRSYSLEGIMSTEALELVLQRAVSGKKIKELAALLVDEDVNLQDATEYVEQLIDHQLLVSELEITVTGPEYFTSLIDRIKKIPESQVIFNKLLKLQKALNSLDHKIGNSIAIYEKPIELAKELVPDLDTKYLFQTDCFSKSHLNSLSEEIKKQLHKAFLVFNKMTVANAGRNLVDFKTNFNKRFEESEVPLHLVLDAETGIGYGSKKEDSNSILDDLQLGPTESKRYEHVIWTDIDRILHEKLITATRNNSYVLHLNEEDFKDIALDYNDLPNTLSSIVEVYNEELLYVKGAGGSSAVNLLGRFSYGAQDLLNHVNHIVGIENELHKGAILAEIVHLPEARTGNILQRPHLRTYEIPYLGKSSLPEEFQIPIEDLLVCVQNNSIILRSKRLNKQIIPRLGNAHNYGSSSLPVYQFLCELQNENKRSWIGFEWNNIHKQQSFLPRVTYENIIFSKARWHIETTTFKKLHKEPDIMKNLSKWQSSLQLPDQVELVEGDNKLLIHLKNKTSVMMLLHTIKSKKRFILEEFLFKEHGIVNDLEGNTYCNQFVVSFGKKIN
ncbi:lantibiotic dehydratase family protein [Nonlabens sp.]|uniref:lantibiotic dehydratase family protein n=1 Tax=Nonlabens sp. TaxID=1888209 RepID=UPI003F69CEC4